MAGAKWVMCSKTSLLPPPPSVLTSSSSSSWRKHLHSNYPIGIITFTRREGRGGWILRRSTTSSSPTPATATNDDTELSNSSAVPLDSGSEVVRKFYGGINSRNVASVEQLIDEDCVYEDLVFPQPFVGRKAILEFFQKFSDSISKDLQFTIDDISDEDNTAVGVTWHLEWKGKPFPFSKGCSFYRLKIVNGQRKITYGRDIVEPATKPGDLALVCVYLSKVMVTSESCLTEKKHMDPCFS